MSFNILDHLEDLTLDGGSSKPNEGSYLCPVCESSNFKVDLTTGQYGSYGCDCAQTPAGKRKIRDAIAPLTWEKPPRPSGKRTFTYDHLSKGVSDAIAQVVREDDGAGKRSFYQQHWNGQRWVKGLPDQVKARLHLYRIFSPINEQAQGQRILLVEGEGKVDSLLALGIPATCSIGGAGKWHQYGHPNYLEDLAGYQVVLCPDRDEIGVKHCETVAADLEAHNITVAGWLYAFPQSPLWERLPKNKGADIADWIAEGATAAEITAAVEPRRQPPRPEQPTPPAGDVDDLPKLAKRFRAVERIWARSLRFNELTNNIELNGEPVEDVGDLRLTLALDYGLSVSVADCEAIVKRLANNNTYHPVAEHLDNCAQTHGTGTAILDNLATDLFGTQVPIHNVFLKKTLVAAVARIFQPGCKVDTALFLQGNQGFNKSSFFKTLVGATWFDDTMGSATSERDERLKLHQFWVLEWAELENVFKKRDISAVKAFLSCGVDTVRPPYGRNAVSLKRRSVIVGSTNQTEFLTDTTGNRRFWVVSVQKRIDLKRVAQLRDSIWAAAVALYRSGYQWWLSDDEEAIAAEFNESYRTEDPWVATVGSYLRNNNLQECTSTELLKHALDIPLGQQNKGHQNRLGEVLRDLGWEPTRLTRGDKRPRGWRAPESDPSPRLEDGSGWISAEIQSQQGFEPDTHNGVIHPPSEDGSGDGQAETLTEQSIEQGDPSRSIQNGQKTQKNNSSNGNGHSPPDDLVPLTSEELETLLEVHGHAG